MASDPTMEERIYDAFTQRMLEKLVSGEPIGAADMSVIRQFIKDQGIEADAKKHPATAGIIKNLPFPISGD